MTHGKTQDAIRRWLKMLTGDRVPREASELLLVASGDADPVWRADVEQVNAYPSVDELCDALMTFASMHADSKGYSVRFFVRWMTADGRILTGTTMRLGDGAIAPMDGSAESLITQMQRTMENALRHAQEQHTEAVNALKWLAKEIVEENQMLRAELRVGREAPTEANNANASTADGPKYKSHTDRVINGLIERVGEKYVDKMFEADAGGKGITPKGDA